MSEKLNYWFVEPKIEQIGWNFCATRPYWINKLHDASMTDLEILGIFGQDFLDKVLAIEEARKAFQKAAAVLGSFKYCPSFKITEL